MERLAKHYTPTAEDLKKILFGRKIVHVDMSPPSQGWETWDAPEGLLTLDDGTTLAVAGNIGGCICGAGDYDLTTLNTVDNAITNVVVEEKPGSDDNCGECGKYSCDHRGFYRVFVVAEDHNQHLVASFEGSDGNGWYGTGWWISVLPPEASQ